MYRLLLRNALFVTATWGAHWLWVKTGHQWGIPMPLFVLVLVWAQDLLFAMVESRFFQKHQVGFGIPNTSTVVTYQNEHGPRRAKFHHRMRCIPAIAASIRMTPSLIPYSWTYSSNKLVQSREAVHMFMQRFEIPGCILGIRAGNYPAFALPFGNVYRPDMLPSGTANEPISTKMLFRIGSVTKSMTATLAVLVAEKGLIKLDDKLGTWFPTAPNAHKISILNMLNMTSGLGDYEQNKSFEKVWFADPLIRWDPKDLVRWSQDQPLDFTTPGTSWHYCNAGYIYVGLILEHVLGMPLHEAFAEHLFRPLNMASTFLATDSAIPGPHAHGFGNVRDKLEDVTEWSPRWAWAAGAVVSNVNDMVKWADNLGKSTLLRSVRRPYTSPSLLDSSSSNIPDKKMHFNHDFFYGLGVLYDDRWVWHNGSIPGWESICAYYPPGDLSIVLNINQSTLPDNKNSESPVTQMFRALTEIWTPEAPLHPVLEK